MHDGKVGKNRFPSLFYTHNARILICLGFNVFFFFVNACSVI